MHVYTDPSGHCSGCQYITGDLRAGSQLLWSDRLADKVDHRKHQEGFWVKYGRPNSRILIVFSLALIVGSLALYQLNRTQQLDSKELSPRRFVDLSESSDLDSDLKTEEITWNGSLRVAVAPVLSPEESLKVYEDFVDYLGAKLGRQAVFLQRSNYAETNDLVRFGLCDLALVCTYSFVRGERDFGMEALVVPVVGGCRCR